MATKNFLDNAGVREIFDQNERRYAKKTDIHTHANLAYLDKFGEDSSGNVTYAGRVINGTTINGSVVKPWAPSTAYNVGDFVIAGGTLYCCTTAHTSTVSITSDIANWAPFKMQVHNDLLGRDAANCHPITAIDGLSTKLGTMTLDIGNNKTDISRIKTQITSMSADITTNKNNISNNANDIRALKTLTTTHTTDINTLKNDVRVLKTDSHKHLNLSQLNKLGEDSNGGLTYNGKAVAGSGGISLWAANTTYEKNDFVVYKNNLYMCIRTHKSPSVFGTASGWQIIGEGITISGSGGSGDPAISMWQPYKRYGLDALVIYDKKIYVCTSTHIGSNIFPVACFEEISACNNKGSSTSAARATDYALLYSLIF